MTKTLSILIAMCAAVAQAKQIALIDTSVTQGSVRLYHIQHFFEVESLARVRSWNPGEGDPVPITRDQAVALARDAARSAGKKDLDEAKMRVEFVNAELFDQKTGAKIKLPKGICLWHYEVYLDCTSQEPEMIYVITMDGKVADRVITR